jgi:hypothetical protein
VKAKYPVSKACLNCKDGVERVYSHDGDVLNDRSAHDAFDIYRLLECDGDWKKALDCYPEITKHNQRIFMQEQAQNRTEPPPQDEANNGDSKKFNLAGFSLNGSSSEMKKKMLSDVFVLPGIALLGQATIIYAKPNTGKTLLTLNRLIESINAGTIKAEDVYYINADDTYKGLVEKLELVEQHGFNMLAPGHNGFKAKEFSKYLSNLISNDDA